MINVLKNFTPHDIVIVDEGTLMLSKVLPSHGEARVSSITKKAGEVCGIPLHVTEYGEVTNLPEPVRGVGYVVSRMTAAALPDRDDLFVPGGLIRDTEGRVVGCTRLERP